MLRVPRSSTTAQGGAFVPIDWKPKHFRHAHTRQGVMHFRRIPHIGCTWSPYRLIHHIDITLTGLPYASRDFRVEDVVALGKTLSLLPLHSITLRARHINPLCNGIILWPTQPEVATVVLCFTRNCPPDEWKRPTFVHLFHSFHALASFELQVCHPRRYYDITDPWQPHPAFDRRARERTYAERGREATYNPSESPLATLLRMGHNASILCPLLVQVSWKERRRNLGQWESRLIICRRRLGSWDPVITQVRDEQHALVAESQPYGDMFAAVERGLP
ncbi:hypothetical protein FA13DRAFT_1712395 [Coprinellus micaceus]|uniref:Uncharacterized protein n=1 Tax=Coprinellus micaceus TaxID=71717 RepID=A0A4Y7T0K8_COPMI|nr:hypothetical protein FA13DRAFT_1712395 [Coprinellus micaceus]